MPYPQLKLSTASRSQMSLNGQGTHACKGWQALTQALHVLARAGKCSRTAQVPHSSTAARCCNANMQLRRQRTVATAPTWSSTRYGLLVLVKYTVKYEVLLVFASAGTPSPMPSSGPRVWLSCSTVAEFETLTDHQQLGDAKKQKGFPANLRQTRAAWNCNTRVSRYPRLSVAFITRGKQARFDVAYRMQRWALCTGRPAASGDWKSSL